MQINNDLETSVFEPDEECVSAASPGLEQTRCAAPKRGRFLPNLLSNGVFFGLSTLIGLWYTPYLIHHLGTAGFGIIPLVNQIVGYMAVVTVGINAAVGRCVTLALERNDQDSANRYFNTAFFGTVFLAAVLTMPAIWASMHTEHLIEVPPGDVLQSRWLFASAAFVFLLNAIGTSFQVSTYCLNRFDLRNYLTAFNKVVSVAVVVLLYSIFSPQIWHVGLGLIIGGITFFIGNVWVYRKLTPQLKVSISYWHRAVLQELISFSGWVSLNSIGAILYLGIDLIVINRMLGPESGGRYAAILQWSSLLRTIGLLIVGLFGPTMLYHYASNNIEQLTLYGRQAVKFTGLLLALPIGLICGLSIPLLKTWLGPSFTDLSWLMSLMTFHLCINIAVMPLFGIQTATGHVRTPAIVTLVMGLGNLALAIFLTGPMGWGLYGPAVAGAIALSAKNIIFTPLHAAHILHLRLNVFLREIVPIMTVTLGIAGVGKLATTIWDMSGWFHLMAISAVISILFIFVAYWLVLSREERYLAWNMLPLSSIKRPGKKL